LNGNKAVGFAEDMTHHCFEKQQQIMARVTGNYKRGNERQAKSHRKNSKL
jgi:hypothetical protein